MSRLKIPGINNYTSEAQHKYRITLTLKEGKRGCECVPCRRPREVVNADRHDGWCGQLHPSAPHATFMKYLIRRQGAHFSTAQRTAGHPYRRLKDHSILIELNNINTTARSGYD